MDEVKLAFETLIVGVFGLVCILVLIDLLWPSASLWDSAIAVFQGSTGHSALTGLLILPVAYVVGAAEFPLADHLFEMDSKISFDLPVIESDDALKVETYVERREWLRASEFPPSLRGHRAHLVSIVPAAPGGLTRQQEEAAEGPVRALYDYQKFVVLKDEDGYRLLKPLYEQVVVLRGTAFNALILAAISLSALFFPGRDKTRYRALLAAAVGIAVISVFGLMEAEREYDKHVVGTYYAMHAVQTGDGADGPVTRDPPAPARSTVSLSR